MLCLVFYPLTKIVSSSHNKISLINTQDFVILEKDQWEPLWPHVFLRNCTNSFIPLKSLPVGRSQMTKKVFEELPESKYFFPQALLRYKWQNLGKIFLVLASSCFPKEFFEPSFLRLVPIFSPVAQTVKGIAAGAVELHRSFLTISHRFTGVLHCQ